MECTALDRLRTEPDRKNYLHIPDYCWIREVHFKRNIPPNWRACSQDTRCTSTKGYYHYWPKKALEENHALISKDAKKIERGKEKAVLLSIRAYERVLFYFVVAKIVRCTWLPSQRFKQFTTGLLQCSAQCHAARIENCVALDQVVQLCQSLNISSSSNSMCPPSILQGSVSLTPQTCHLWCTLCTAEHPLHPLQNLCQQYYYVDKKKGGDC